MNAEQILKRIDERAERARYVESKETNSRQRTWYSAAASALELMAEEIRAEIKGEG